MCVYEGCKCGASKIILLFKQFCIIFYVISLTFEMYYRVLKISPGAMRMRGKLSVKRRNFKGSVQRKLRGSKMVLLDGYGPCIVALDIILST
jgi:hypothetical protein